MQTQRFQRKWLSDEELVRFKPSTGENPLLKALEARRSRRRVA